LLRKAIDRQGLTDCLFDWSSREIDKTKIQLWKGDKYQKQKKKKKIKKIKKIKKKKKKKKFKKFKKFKKKI